jgi:transposase
LEEIPEEKRVYVDECGINTYLQREYGRAERGKLVEDTKPGKRFVRLNIIGAVANKKYYAIENYRHSTDAAFFEKWFEKTLLENIPNSCTVIMDNARFHRKKRLEELSQGKANLLFLPPYSPDFNPIEHSWANMKHFIRSEQKKYENLDIAVNEFFKNISN